MYPYHLSLETKIPYVDRSPISIHLSPISHPSRPVHPPPCTCMAGHVGPQHGVRRPACIPSGGGSTLLFQFFVIFFIPGPSYIYWSCCRHDDDTNVTAIFVFVGTFRFRFRSGRLMVCPCMWRSSNRSYEVVSVSHLKILFTLPSSCHRRVT